MTRPNTADICMYWCNDADIQVGEEGHWKVGRSATIAYLCRRLDEAEKQLEEYRSMLLSQRVHVPKPEEDQSDA